MGNRQCDQKIKIKQIKIAQNKNQNNNNNNNNLKETNEEKKAEEHVNTMGSITDLVFC